MEESRIIGRAGLVGMRRKVLIGVALLTTITSLLLFGNYWVSTQPVWVYENKVFANPASNPLPQKNHQLLQFIESKGKSLAPHYEDVVCTEYLIEVIDQFEPLTAEDKNKIRIITAGNLTNLVQQESSVIKGVQASLTQNKKGIAITDVREVRPGDLVQFWNHYNGKEYGHCGVVLDIEPYESITLYSSHRFTDGYGKQKYLWPDKIFFVRLK